MRLSLMFLVLSIVNVNISNGVDIDSNGYILYCPCMGRFGNQADHFLGVLSFAKGLNRTLVLPPWVEYEAGKSESTQVPFDRYFKVSAVAEYHRAITMEYFMKELAPSIWPAGKRKVYCYMERPGTKKNSCNAKDGSPFGPFWNTFKIDFDASEFYGAIGYSADQPRVAAEWNKRYPPSTHLVLAFTGAPADFPVRKEHVPLQRYLVWSDAINSQVDNFIAKNIPERPFLGIHLRHGSDWKNACKHVKEEGMSQLFGSAQCLGYNNEYGKLTNELCFPPEKTVISQVKEAVKAIGAKALFVASDDDRMIGKFEKALKKQQVKVVHMAAQSEPHVELAILARADHYICNCVSTFSHFATRERLANGKKTDFWAFKRNRDEL